MEKVCFKNLENLSDWAVDFIVDLANKTIKERGYFTISLCGGSSPQLLFKKLAENHNSDKIDFSKVFVFWGDDRFVPSDSDYSNLKLANDLMLSKINIPKENIFKVPTHLDSPKETAKKYEDTIRNFFRKRNRSIPKFDLILLGIGPDGHTASLFPGIPELKEKKKLVVNVKAPDYVDIEDRITFTFKLINDAENILIFLAGTDKKNIIETFLSDDNDLTYPIQYVSKSDKTIALLDKSAPHTPYLSAIAP